MYVRLLILLLSMHRIKQAPPVGGPGYQFPMVAVAPQPPYNAPHDFLILAMVTTIICAILNLISLAFGIPAIILSAMVILQSCKNLIFSNIYIMVWGQGFNYVLAHYPALSMTSV